MTTTPGVCAVFRYFLGAIANAQPRFKQFLWSHMWKKDFPEVFDRVLLSIFFLNVLKILFSAR
jgi:hypothetical protein